MFDTWHIQDGEISTGPHTLAEVHNILRTGSVSDDAWFGCDDVWIDYRAFLRSHPSTQSHIGPDLAKTSPEQSPQATEIEVDAEISTAPPERDAILILGRRRAGKTIYLATLYANFWKSTSGLVMKSLSGPTHMTLMDIANQLKTGQWPDATLGTRQLEFEIDYRGQSHLLVAFDYSGEDFRRAFIDEDISSPEVKKLLNYVDRASAVILLMDPSVMIDGKHDEIADDDFGMVQAVQRIRNWPGGEHVPIVIVLTKADRNRALIQSHGTAPNFVLRHYPALARTLVKVPIFPVCAVQEVLRENGQVLPKPDSLPVNIEKPLIYCFEEFRRRETRQEAEAARQAKDESQRLRLMAEEKALAKSQRRLWIYIICFVALALCGYTVMYILLTR